MEEITGPHAAPESQTDRKETGTGAVATMGPEMEATCIKGTAMTAAGALRGVGMNAADIRPGRLYDDLAWLFPIITPPEEYAEEATHWRAALRERLGPGRHRILELGVGGGHNLSHLTADYDATAVDLSEAMLHHCRRLNPDVELHVGDMRTVRLGRTFDAVLIHDAVGHLLTEADLVATFETAAAHLKPGGVLIVAPDLFAETFRPSEVSHATHRAGGLEVTYLEYIYDTDPTDTQVETIMVFMILQDGRLRIECDRSAQGLFARPVWTGALETAGFEADSQVFALSEWPHPYELIVGRFRGAGPTAGPRD